MSQTIGDPPFRVLNLLSLTQGTLTHSLILLPTPPRRTFCTLPCLALQFPNPPQHSITPSSHVPCLTDKYSQHNILIHLDLVYQGRRMLYSAASFKSLPLVISSPAKVGWTQQITHIYRLEYNRVLLYTPT